MESVNFFSLVHCLLSVLAEWGRREKDHPLQGCEAGDPLSPMLFLLVMEPLHRLFKKAQDLGLLGNRSSSCVTFRMSLYADDVAEE
jgi:hypothetical protein